MSAVLEVLSAQRKTRMSRLVAQASCLPEMLRAVEFIGAEARQVEMMIECHNFAEDICQELSKLMREGL